MHRRRENALCVLDRMEYFDEDERALRRKLLEGNLARLQSRP